MNVFLRCLGKELICYANTPGWRVFFFCLLKVGFCWLSPGFGERHGFAGAKSAKDWCGFAHLLGDLLWLTARVCKVKICFARLASQALLASNFCLARQKSPKSR